MQFLVVVYTLAWRSYDTRWLVFSLLAVDDNLFSSRTAPPAVYPLRCILSSFIFLCPHTSGRQGLGSLMQFLSE